MNAIEKKIQTNEFYSDVEFEQYLLDFKYFQRHTSLKKI